MNPAELLNKVIASGADAKGIQDRFAGNIELYEDCFREFLEEPSFALLGEALKKKDYEQAFQAAHALKGLSGNLGLTGFYDAVCPLVESLRRRDGGPVAEQYAHVLRQEERLRRLVADAPEPEPPPEPPPAAPPAVPGTDAAKNRSFFLRLFALMLLVLLAITAFFGHLLVNYRENVERESADHLLEINYQIKLYIEEKIANDWKTAHSVGASIAYSNYVDDDAAIFALMHRQREVWDVTDIKLYTESGYAVCSDGAVDHNDVASEAVMNARRLGEYMSVYDSSLIYTVPVDTQLSYGGSRIVAVAVEQSMGAFLDDMGFSSFGGEAWMALTEENGVIFSMLTNDAAPRAFNFLAVVGERELSGLDGRAEARELLTATEPAAFLMADGRTTDYLVSTPLQVRGKTLRLFYVAPESVVNRTMNGFSRRMLALSVTVILLFTGVSVAGFLYIYRTRMRLFSKELRARERMFDLLVRNTRAAFGLFTVNDPAPVYVSANTASIIGEPYFTLHERDGAFFMRGSEGRETEALREVNERMRTWDGHSEFKSGYLTNERSAAPNWFSLELYPVDGAGAGFVGIAQDVTQAYQREEATRTALEMAERSNDAKSRFLSNMSHDIRTPMNAIMNMTDFALESIDKPKRLGEYLQTIRESSEHLLRLINDVLDMSRIESGQTVIAAEPFDLREELKRQCDMIRPLCAARSQTLITDFRRVRVINVCGDRVKFTQVIMNLLSNAVKFTPEHGAVRFSAEQVPSLREDMVDLRFTVEDTGIGISPDYIGRIFDPFSRADDRRVNRIEGTGLGLSICRSYVEAMGGTISCESEEGEGSTFTVELFFQLSDAADRDGGDTAVSGDTPFLGKRCLVAEDNDINQTIARTLLERLGFLVEMAADGSECVQEFLDSAPGAYDVIYMDIQMPILDGYHAAVAIRESAHPQAQSIPIVAMTANVFAEDIEKARITGMDGYLGKPITSFHLIDETNKAIKKRRGHER